MTEKAAGELTGFAFVVTGGMNPAIHHPAWYKYIGLLSDKDFDNALKSDFLFLPQLTRFSASFFDLTCEPQRWQVHTENVDQSERILELGKALFDEHLPHTPVNAVGLNFNFHFLTQLSNVGEYLASQLARLDLNLPSQTGASGLITHRTPMESGYLRMSIEPSKQGERFIYIGFNRHIALESSEDTVKKIDLGKLVFDKYAEARRIVHDRVDAVLKVTGKGEN